VSDSLRGVASWPARFGLVARIWVCASVIAVETLFASYLIQATPLEAVTGPAEVVRHLQHWFFRFAIAYAMSIGILMYLRKDAFATLFASADHAPLRARYGILHALLLVPFAYLSAGLYASSSVASFALIALAWHACAAVGALALLAALAPLSVWTHAARQTASVALFAVVPAAAAVAAIRVSQMLWAPAAELTFRIVVILLRPLLPTLVSEPATLTLSTGRFAVQIAEMCSGLEGVGLMLAFCAAWLWFFRREYYFPRALIVVPFGVLLVFLLNAVRIAALVLIGDAGYERMATVGFHSQAGWIGFNLAAFGVAILAHTNPWFSRTARTRRSLRDGAIAAGRLAHPPDAAVDPANRGAAIRGVAGPAEINWTAAYLMPLLVVLATGMITHALSIGFEALYPLRLAGALVVLWIYRRAYAELDLRFSWRGPAVGAGVFLLWIACAAFMTSPSGAPALLSSMPVPARSVWIGCRALAAVFTVPIAEELAYRGYLLRRLTARSFETVPYSAARWPALLVSAVAFGLTHAGLWVPGIAAGLAYGALAIRTNRLGECIAAHAFTNALLAVYVLGFNQWQLW
jgi:exosortase E/protease (VPEID-CTERM system)